MPTATTDPASPVVVAHNGNGFAPRPRRVYHRFDPARSTGTMTVDEWDAFVRKSKHKYHYVSGEAIEMAGASPEHNLLCMNTAVTLQTAFLAVNSPCEVLGSDQRVFVRRNLYYFPDLVVVCGKMDIDPRDAIQNPVAIVEVLSPTTENDDRSQKFAEYREIASLRHYVLIDQNRVWVTHFAKTDDGLWVLAGEYRDLEGVLTLAFGETVVPVPVSRIYRNVPLPEGQTVA